MKKEVNKLQEMSMHCVENAWHKIDFCDEERGIHRATLAEQLHCVQQGIFEYAIKALFEQKKKKKLIEGRWKGLEKLLFFARSPFSPK